MADHTAAGSRKQLTARGATRNSACQTGTEKELLQCESDRDSWNRIPADIKGEQKIAIFRSKYKKLRAFPMQPAGEWWTDEKGEMRTRLSRTGRSLRGPTWTMDNYTKSKQARK